MGASSLAYATDTSFSLVPADPPLKGRVDCSSIFEEFGFEEKNLGQILTLIKAFNGASSSIKDQIDYGFDNGGDFMKSAVFEQCNIGPK